MANLLTLLRIVLAAPFAAMFFISADWAMPAALAIFALAAATDFFDGALARARGETSRLGAALDPVADKVLVATALLALTKNGVLAGPTAAAAIAVIARETLVAGLREALGKEGANLAVTGLAKVKTTAQLVAIGALVAAAPGGVVGPRFAAPADGLFWAASALTLWTGGVYVIDASRLLRRTP